MNIQKNKIIGASSEQRGFSLIELMIAMTIGLFMVATVGYVFVSAKQTFNSLEGLAYIQENARYAFDYMGKDIRMAGFTGGYTSTDLTPPDLGNTTLNALIDLYDTPLNGYEAGETVPGVTPKTGTDSLTVVRADDEHEFSLSAAPSGNTLTITCPPAGAGIPLPQAGEMFVISDYTNSGIFRVNSADSSCSGTMSLTASSSTPLPASFGGGYQATKLYRLRGATYYIDNTPDEPTLTRLEIGINSGAPAAKTLPLIEGVTNMQIEYGEDGDTNQWNGTPPDTTRAVTVYRDADDVVNWNKVLSVRITLTLASRQGINIATTGGVLEKNMTTTIAVRNRLQ